MLFAERTVFIDVQSVGIVLLILKRIVISILALRAFERDFCSRCFYCHIENSVQKNYTPNFRCVHRVYHTQRGLVNRFFVCFLPFFIFFRLFFRLNSVLRTLFYPNLCIRFSKTALSTPRPAPRSPQTARSPVRLAFCAERACEWRQGCNIA